MTKKLKEQYDSEDISILTDREHVRLRTQIYLGDMSRRSFEILDFFQPKIAFTQVELVPAVYKAVGEIIDNSIDEFAHGFQSKPELTIEADTTEGRYLIADNGRGVPISIHEVAKIHTPQVVFGSLRSGRNFSDDNKATGVQGQNGVGSSITNYCSKEFKINITREGKRYVQTFTDGGLDVTKPKITAGPKTSTGTNIEFQLDDEVFKNGVQIQDVVMRNRAYEIAVLNPGWKVHYNTDTFHFKDGLKGVIKQLTSSSYGTFTYESPDFVAEVYVLPKTHNEPSEKVFTWINSSFLLDGGKINTQLVNAFVDNAVQTVDKKLAKDGVTANRQDVVSGVTFVVNVKVKNPTFDGQAKTRQTGPDLRKEVQDMVTAGWKTFGRTCNDWLEEVQEAAINRSMKSLSKKLDTDAKKTKKLRIEGLLDATSSNRQECQLLVVEGLSAQAQVSDVRNPKTTAAYALTGKINNVYGTSIVKLSQMEKVMPLLNTIGLVPGKKADRSKLNFGKLVISTDADYDGSDIFVTIVCLIYEYWPELLDPKNPFVYRLVAPNVCAIKNDKRVHFANRVDYEKVKDKYKREGWQIKYYKGLGSMSSVDWEMIFERGTPGYIPIVEDGRIKQTMELLFGEDTQARKDWLTQPSTVPNLPDNQLSTSDYLNKERREYAMYTMTSRAISSLTDGLKPSGRRPLWIARDGKTYKTATLAGATMPLHPHAECSDAIGTLTAFYSNNVPLFEGDGSFGTKLTPHVYGAPRYTSVKVTKFAQDVIFKDLDIAPLVDNYDSTEKEPLHFLPLMPIAMLNPTEGITIGFRADIYPRRVSDVIKAQIAHLRGKKYKEPLPFFESLQQYATQVSPNRFETKGTFVRNSTSVLTITELAYGETHANLVKKLIKLEDAGIIQDFEDSSRNVINIKVTFKRGELSKMTDAAIEKMFDLVNAKTEFMNILDETGGTVAHLSTSDFINRFTDWRLAWYKPRYEKQLKLLEVDLSRYLDIRIAIKNNVGNKAIKIKSRSEFKAYLETIKIVNLDYIADLSVYRFTQEEYDANEQKIAEVMLKIDDIRSIIKSEDRRKDIYVTELEEVLAQYNKKKYTRF